MGEILLNSFRFIVATRLSLHVYIESYLRSQATQKSSATTTT